MTQKVDITTAKPEDVQTISEIEKMIFSDPWNERSLLESIESDHEIIFVAKLDDKIIGYVIASFVFDEANINRIAVLPEYRGRKTGTFLLNELEKHLSQTEVFNLEVRESNIYAINMYTDKGYETVGKRKRFYRNPDEDAVLMTKRKVMI